METTRYVYGHGKWHEVGAGFLEPLEEERRELLGKSSSFRLPAWPKGVANGKGRDSHDEDGYNKQAAGQEGHLLFDKKITVGSLFAFAQVSLLQSARRLLATNAEVEVVAIRC